MIGAGFGTSESGAALRHLGTTREKLLSRLKPAGLGGGLGGIPVMGRDFRLHLYSSVSRQRTVWGCGCWRHLIFHGSSMC